MASTDAMPVPRKNVAYRVTFPIQDNDGDLVTGAAGLDSEVSKDGAGFADCTNEATEIGSTGIYTLDLTSTEMNADTVAIIVKTSTTDAKTVPIVLYPQETGDIKVDVTSFGGTAGTFASGRPEVNTTHVAGSSQTAGDIAALLATIASYIDTEVGAIKTKTDQLTFTTANQVDTQTLSIAANAITATAIATDAIGSAEVSAAAVTKIQAGLSTLDAAGVRTAVGLASANLDTQLAAIASYIDTEVAAIKAKTDNLPAAPSAVGDIPSAASIATAVLTAANGIETSYSLQAALRLILAVCSGRISGGGTGTEVIRDINNSKNRLSFTVDANGNRTAVTPDAT